MTYRIQESKNRTLNCGLLLPVAASLLFFAVAAVPCWADILVTNDGARIEIDGPWEVKGQRVLFRTAVTKTLSFMRLSEVDLEASERATAFAQPPTAFEDEPEAEPRLGSMSQRDRPEATRTWTNDDVGQASTKELEALARVFGGAMMELLAKTGDQMAETGEFSEEDKEEFDTGMKEQERALRQGYEDALLALASVAKSYPELQELNTSNPESVRLHANAITSAAKELRVAAYQSQSEGASKLLNAVALQLESVLGKQ